MIVEAIVTTCDAEGRVNVAPMGPEVDETVQSFVLKPFKSSTTYQNLLTCPHAVIHLTDDVELIAQAAIGKLDATSVTEKFLDRWWKLRDCCRWFAIEVSECEPDSHPDRVRACCRVVHQGEQRSMLGFCRAKHAVIEASILATRISFLGRSEVKHQMELLRPLIEKTAGLGEQMAWSQLERFVDG